MSLTLPHSVQSLYPTPRQVALDAGECRLHAELTLEMPTAWGPLLIPELSRLGAVLAQRSPGRVHVTIRQGEDSSGPEGYQLHVTQDGVTLNAGDAAGARYGLRTLLQLCASAALPCCTITDWPTLRWRGIQIDLGRVLERPETVERLIAHYAEMRYNVLQLYLENALQFPSAPALARPWAWTLEQAMQVVDCATRYGLGVIPALQSLGHCHWVTGHPQYADLDECAPKFTGILCPEHPRTSTMLHGMIADVAPLATAGMIHLGMDEVTHLGQCARCAPLRAEIGEGGIFVRHANRVAAMVRAVGKRPAIWGDMFHYFPQPLEDLDTDILIFDWYYYRFRHTPGIELFGYREDDTIAVFRRHGLDVWGCPSSFYTAMMPLCLPAESIENARDWTRYLLQHQQQGIMVTQWELSPVTIDTCLPIEGAIAGFIWGDGMAAPAEALLQQACAHLCSSTEVASCLQTLGALRFHGHAARRWLRATDLAQMRTNEAPEPDLDRAATCDALVASMTDLLPRAQHAEIIKGFIAAARWLAYTYRKRGLINRAAAMLFTESAADVPHILARLRDEALTVAEAFEAEWRRNRFPEDPAPTPQRLREEARMFEQEITAMSTQGSRTSQLTSPFIAVDVIDRFAACCQLHVETSRDGQTFTRRASCWILQFDSAAVLREHADLIRYIVTVDDPGEAAFVRVVAAGPGRFVLRNVSLHHGTRQRSIIDAQGEGLVEGAEGLKTGGEAVLGHPDPEHLFRELEAAGNSSPIYTIEHGQVTVRLA
jgi:hypothetical protein